LRMAMFAKKMMKMTTLLAKDRTTLYLHFEFHAIYMKVIL
jgi:hypothetical protein